jgi:hypothetical protein
MFKLPQAAYEILTLFNDQKSWKQDEITDALKNFKVKDIKYALKKLKKKGIITRIPNLSDMRRAFYRVATVDEFYDTSKTMKPEEMNYCKQILATYLDQNRVNQ